MMLSRLPSRCSHNWAINIIKGMMLRLHLNEPVPFLNSIGLTSFQKTVEFTNPLNSPLCRLALCNFSVFPKLKTHLKGNIWGFGGHEKKYDGTALYHIQRGVPEIISNGLFRQKLMFYSMFISVLVNTSSISVFFNTPCIYSLNCLINALDCIDIPNIYNTNPLIFIYSHKKKLPCILKWNSFFFNKEWICSEDFSLKISIFHLENFSLSNFKYKN